MIHFQKMIYREDLRANPNTVYVFGDNTLRMGYGGQAKEMRGEPNAVGVCTKWAPGMNDRDFFDDINFQQIQKIILDDLIVIHSHMVNAKRLIVMPLDGLGTGLSQLPTRAPRVHAWLQQQIEILKNM